MSRSYSNPKVDRFISTNYPKIHSHCYKKNCTELDLQNDAIRFELGIQMNAKLKWQSKYETKQRENQFLMNKLIKIEDESDFLREQIESLTSEMISTKYKNQPLSLDSQSQLHLDQISTERRESIHTYSLPMTQHSFPLHSDHNHSISRHRAASTTTSSPSLTNYQKQKEEKEEEEFLKVIQQQQLQEAQEAKQREQEAKQRQKEAKAAKKKEAKAKKAKKKAKLQKDKEKELNRKRKLNELSTDSSSILETKRARIGEKT